MNKSYQFFLSFFCFWHSLGFSVSGLDKLENKEVISQIQERISKTNLSDRGSILVDLAYAYYRDQDHENAFRAFLSALAFVPKNDNIPMSKEEISYYNKALEIYLGHNSGFGARDAAQKLLEEYAEILEKNPDFYHLSFLIAAAYANLGDYENFFFHFYRSFLKYPDSYMAYRTKAILHIKLHERAKTETEREEQRQSIFDNLLNASGKKNDDSSLYKLMIVFADKIAKPEVIKTSLNFIITHNVIVPRSDILFFVTEALNNEDIDLAQSFVNRAKEWYSVSRVVNGAQDMIDTVRKRKT